MICQRNQLHDVNRSITYIVHQPDLHDCTYMAASTFTNHNRNNMDQLGISNSLLHDMGISASSTGPQKVESASMTVVLSLWSTSVMSWRRLTLIMLVVAF